jgi:polyisoprenoid-binding protein YceI
VTIVRQSSACLLHAAEDEWNRLYKPRRWKTAPNGDREASYATYDLRSLASMLFVGHPSWAFLKHYKQGSPMIRRIILVAALCLASSSLYATTYTLQPNYTQGVFRWNHLGFSSPAAQFGQAEGTLEFDSKSPSKASVQVTIPLASLSTSVPELDEHLRTADFFDVAKFPIATFKSTKVEAGATSDKLKVTGDLTMHGVSKPVTLNVAIIKVGMNPRLNVPCVGFDATTTLKRSEFDLGKFVPLVSDDIQVQISSEVAEAQGYAEYLKAEEAAAKKQ